MKKIETKPKFLNLKSIFNHLLPPPQSSSCLSPPPLHDSNICHHSFFRSDNSLYPPHPSPQARPIHLTAFLLPLSSSHHLCRIFFLLFMTLSHSVNKKKSKSNNEREMMSKLFTIQANWQGPFCRNYMLFIESVEVTYLQSTVLSSSPQLSSSKNHLIWLCSRGWGLASKLGGRFGWTADLIGTLKIPVPPHFPTKFQQRIGAVSVGGGGSSRGEEKSGSLGLVKKDKA